MSERADQILPHGRVLRYPFVERLNHWIAAGSYMYLLLTGLAFWSPLCFWIAGLLGGGQIWIGAVVSRADSVELSLGAFSFRVFASCRCARDHRKFHDSHLHECVCRARRIWLGDSRRRFAGVRQALSSRLV